MYSGSLARLIIIVSAATADDVIIVVRGKPEHRIMQWLQEKLGGGCSGMMS